MNNGLSDCAIKFGAGRYRQGRGVLHDSGEEIRRFGSRVYILAGPKALKAAGERLFESLERAGVAYTAEVYQGYCSYEAAREQAEKCLAAGCDEVVGVGGGRIMDFAKAVAEFAGVGVVNIPTSIATCAAFTSMSVMYTQEGAYLESWRYGHETDAVLVDLDVIAACPPRLAAAGMIDAMAKRIEIPNGRSEMRPEEQDCDLYTAYRIAEYVYEMLENFGPRAVEDIRRRQVTRAVEYVTFLNIAVTGTVANITRSFGQSALAHMLYYGMRTIFTREAEHALHGEIVGIGLFPQLICNRMDRERGRLAKFMAALGLPLTFKELGIQIEGEAAIRLDNYLADSPYVQKTEEGIGRFRRAMEELI